MYGTVYKFSINDELFRLRSAAPRKLQVDLENEIVRKHPDMIRYSDEELSMMCRVCYYSLNDKEFKSQ